MELKHKLGGDFDMTLLLLIVPYGIETLDTTHTADVHTDF